VSTWKSDPQFFGLNKQVPIPKRRWVQPGDDTMSLIIYLIGFAFVIGGIAWVLILTGVSSLHVMIAVIILVGIAILTGVTRTRTRD